MEEAGMEWAGTPQRRVMNHIWSKTWVEWQDQGTMYLSVPFTWNLPEVYSRCVWLEAEGYMRVVGGPAVRLMPDYLKDVAMIGGDMDALPRHNPEATFTSRGCIRHCSFCAVPRIEGDLVELAKWQPKPIICDNNLLACSHAHFNRVIDSLRGIKNVDFNQGLDARLLRQKHIDRLCELDLAVVRLAWDHVNNESSVVNSINLLAAAGIPKNKIRVYVLIGYDDTPDDALYRFMRLREMGIWPNPQRYNPLDALRRDTYVAPRWTQIELHRYMRYWARQVWLEHVPFEDYK